MEVQLELFPCPICKRKFIKKSLEVHLRSCDKQGKYHKIDKILEKKKKKKKVKKVLKKQESK